METIKIRYNDHYSKADDSVHLPSDTEFVTHRIKYSNDVDEPKYVQDFNGDYLIKAYGQWVRADDFFETLDGLVKGGKGLPPGTRRTWSGQEYEKTAMGKWIPVTEPRTKKQEEASHERGKKPMPHRFDFSRIDSASLRRYAEETSVANLRNFVNHEGMTSDGVSVGEIAGKRVKEVEAEEKKKQEEKEKKTKEEVELDDAKDKLKELKAKSKSAYEKLIDSLNAMYAGEGLDEYEEVRKYDEKYDEYEYTEDINIFEEDKVIADDMGWTPRQLDSMLFYRGWGHGPINQYFYKGRKEIGIEVAAPSGWDKVHFTAKEMEDRVKDIEHCLDTLPDYKGTVYNGTRIRVDMKEFMKVHKLGSEIEFDAIVSASDVKSIAWNFTSRNNGLMYKINAKGVKDTREFNPGESELMYKTKSKFRVTKEPFLETDGVKQYWLVEVDEI